MTCPEPVPGDELLPGRETAPALPPDHAETAEDTAPLVEKEVG